MVATRATLARTGQPAEADCPAYIHGTAWTPPVDAATFKGDFTTLGGVEPLLEAIRDGWYPVICVSLNEQFYSPRAPWIITAGPEAIGRHAMLAVGLANQQGSSHVLVRNSWGDDWANGGHAWLDETFLNSHLLDAFVVEAH